LYDTAHEEVLGSITAIEDFPIPSNFAKNAGQPRPTLNNLTDAKVRRNSHILHELKYNHYTLK